ncbi:Ribokinase-like protein [Halteromyces radiatus]|uniref:Ribokinase-like protein n=1 Tax=Halteromyces radiatus TaxID=101107 RepID=UPI002220B5A6|nr:Ribokinase-like protein [Halteromyces radiatus]KAI8096817.1 Ribokinase-like protein [Halteromyces radiatus]
MFYQRPLLVIGGVALDITATASTNTNNGIQSLLHTSTPGIVRQTLGGVGRNVCEAALRTGTSSILYSAIGNDLAGSTILKGMTDMNMDTSLLDVLPTKATAVYNAFHSKDGQLITAVADMDIFDSLSMNKLQDVFKKFHPSLVCFDGNITAKAMEMVTSTCVSFGVPAFFEPTSIPKSLKIFDSSKTLLSGAIQYTSPNQFELEGMVDQAKTRFQSSSTEKSMLQYPVLPTNAPPIAHQTLPDALYLSNYIPHIITKLGEYGCLYVGPKQGQKHQKSMHYFTPEFLDPDTVKSVTGAGDSFVGTILANLVKNPFPEDLNIWQRIIPFGQQAAIRTLQSDLAVSPLIDKDLLL